MKLLEILSDKVVSVMNLRIESNEPAGCVDEDNLPVALETCQDSVVKLCVLANPRVAVVDVRGRDVLVGNVGQNDKPLLKELGSESIKRN